MTDIVDITKILKSSLQYSLDGGINWSTWPSNNYLNLGTIEKGAQLNILILGIVSSSAQNEIINTASIVTSTNNQSTQTTSTSKTTVLTNAVLTIGKSGYPAAVTPGQMINYTITIVNNGNSDAQNVKIYDTLNNLLQNGQY
jgi:uncharacterized repeat protein (TIGR01451 family)